MEGFQDILKLCRLAIVAIVTLAIFDKLQSSQQAQQLLSFAALIWGGYHIFRYLLHMSKETN